MLKRLIAAGFAVSVLGAWAAPAADVAPKRSAGCNLRRRRREWTEQGVAHAAARPRQPEDQE